MMNAKAAELGMTDTTFKNACGLDTEGHLSTARNVAIMSRTILTQYPEVLPLQRHLGPIRCATARPCW